jgi:hypothetical protein
MLLRPLRAAPFMLGGVGFQAGLDEVERRRVAAQRQAAAQAPVAAPARPDVVAQLRSLKGLLDDGAISAEEFELAKRKVLDG